MRKVPNFSRYAVDEKGNVHSLNYKNSKTTKQLKPSKSNDGYYQTMIQDDNGKYHSMKIHRIVCLAYHGIRTDGMEINHIDCDKTNNAPTNLEYVTKSKNIQHAYDNGLIIKRKGSLNSNSKLNDLAVKTIREQAKKSGRYYGRKELAQRFGISEAHVKDIVNSKTLWSHV